jgi:hypothetical protein
MGALQFQHDMRALFLIFHDFTTSPQNFFKECVLPLSLSLIPVCACVYGVYVCMSNAACVRSVKEAAVVLTLTAEARERMRGLLAPLLATPAADTRVSLLTSRSRASLTASVRDGDGDALGHQAPPPTAGERDDGDDGDHRAEPFARFGLFKLTPRQIDLILSLRIDHHGL